MVLVKRLLEIMRREEGSVAILVGLIMFLLILAAGVAVDMTRAQILQQRMSSALDASGLAAAKIVASPPPNTCSIPISLSCAQTIATQEANRYFVANFPTGYLASTPGNVTVTVSADLATLTLNVAAVQSTVFMRAFGVQNMNIGAASTVTRNADLGIELALVLDTTGSMNVTLPGQPTNKLTALKNSLTGSGGLMDILFGSGATATNLFVGVVPFSQAVNVGTTISSTSYDAAFNATIPWPPASAGPQGQWAGCVQARQAPATLTDDRPTSGATLLQQYFFRARRSGDPVNVWVVFFNKWENAFGGGPPFNFGLPSPSDVFGENVTMGPNLFCPQRVTPLSSTKSTVVNAINSLTPSGDTVIPDGLVWGYRMLSPNWRGIWQGLPSSSLPQDYNSPTSKKILVLMTDGSNHLSFGVMTSYGFFGDIASSLLLNFAGQEQAEQILDANTLAICNSIKSHNVTVYTIGFGTAATNNPITQADRDAGLINATLLQQCATDADHFFIAPTNAVLQAVFQQIGNSLANLRVSK